VRAPCAPARFSRGSDGLTTKVLNERLRKLVRFGLVTRTASPEIPPRAEDRLSPLGGRFTRLLDQLEQLQAELNGHSLSRTGQP
jgi:DNA-binding HxlR family transcriptional regulator